jgi:hypothetical protein
MLQTSFKKPCINYVLVLVLKKLIILTKMNLQLQHQRRTTSAALINYNSITHATTTKALLEALTGEMRRAINEGI